MADRQVPPIIIEIKTRDDASAGISKVKADTSSMADSVEKDTSRAGSSFDQMGEHGKSLASGIGPSILGVSTKMLSIVSAAGLAAGAIPAIGAASVSLIGLV